jgi:hypothetical protein
MQLLLLIFFPFGGFSSLLSTLDILSTLCLIFNRNENSKNVFRLSSGFVWLLSVLGGTANFGKPGASGGALSTNAPNAPNAPNATKQIDSADVFRFLNVLLYTLSRALANNTLNQQYFRRDIQFATLATSLLEYSHFIAGSRIVELCDSLLNTALRGTWPPSCPRHPAQELLPPWETPREERQFEFQSSALSITAQLTCAVCKESLHVENPEILSLIVQFMGTIVQKQDNDGKRERERES